MFHWSLVTLFVWAVAVVNADGENQPQQQDHQLHFLAPHPLSGQVVAAEYMMKMMMATTLEHYGKPPSECQPDELAFEISGVPGMVCAPTCDANDRCPNDLPDGVSATPQCALENRATGDKYCVLICVAANADATVDVPTPVFLRGHDNHNADNTPPLTDGMCGDATCQEVQPGLGICTYDIEK